MAAIVELFSLDLALLALLLWVAAALNDDTVLRVCVCDRFYEYGLLPGVHFVTVDTAADVPAMVKYLREHDDYARAVALAGRARMAALDTDAVADFMAELLKQYAAKQVCACV